MGVGEALTEARGRAGLTVAEVSQRTRIREAIIIGIEGEDYSGCGGDFYARGHIRSIAKAVGADPGPLIGEYDALHRAPGVLSAVSLDELRTEAHAPERRRVPWTVVLAVVLIAALGVVGYTFLAGSPRAEGRPPAAADHGLTHAGPGPPGPKPGRSASPLHPTAAARAPLRPPLAVRAYVAAINGHHYARAWRLGGQNTGGSYPSFVSGFTGTAHDTLTIVSVAGDVVTARLSAQQTDGTVQIYQGTYTVHHGVITGFDIVQLS